ncbi:hypothetical protein FF2_014880 [Malus domestica]
MAKTIRPLKATLYILLVAITLGFASSTRIIDEVQPNESNPLPTLFLPRTLCQVERSNDIIINGGENTSSVEGESVLYANSAVNEATVVAKPGEFWGDAEEG